MTTRMEKMACTAAKRAQQRRHFEGRIRQAIRAADIQDMQTTGRRAGHRIHSVWVGVDAISIYGDEWVAMLAGKLLAQSGVINIEIYQRWHASEEYVACGEVLSVSPAK